MSNKKYLCKDNDAVIKTFYDEYYGLDEMWVGIVGDKKCGMIVVGANDLNCALKKHLVNLLVHFQSRLCDWDLIGSSAWDHKKQAKIFVEELTEDKNYCGDYGEVISCNNE